MDLTKWLGICAALVAMQPGSSAAAPSPDQATIAEIEKADFFRPGFAPVRNTRSYDITVVYFFDYQCPVCRQHHAGVSKALAEDKRVRVIYRDTPIFGPNSDAAANAAIASQLQGRHEALHDALMSTKGPIDAAALRAAARKSGVDWDRLQRDLKTHESRIELLVARNLELAMDAGIHGTPAFIVGDALANGALDYAGLKGEIADARKSSGAGSARPLANQAQDDDSRQPDSQTSLATKRPSSPDEPTSVTPAFMESKRPDTVGAAMSPERDNGFESNVLWFGGAGGLILAISSLAWWRRRRVATKA